MEEANVEAKNAREDPSVRLLSSNLSSYLEQSKRYPNIAVSFCSLLDTLNALSF